ncbi:MAG: DUF1285 domain-containing protein [Cellvibrionales bacterium]|nr:DUF1285 domain-containing protein [Cellvibrionales bacterium]
MSFDLEALLARIDSPNSLPPVHQWHPTVERTMDIVIDAQGRWIHEGDVIERPAICQLLSSILVYEGGQYFLKSPVEKVAIQVVDVPFIAELLIGDDSETPYFVTQTEDLIAFDTTLDAELREYQGVSLPYIKVRNNLYARLSRALFFAFADNEAAHQFKDGVCYYQQKDGLLPLGALSGQE